MAAVVKTYIFCFDDHRNFSDDIKKRFSDSTRYIVTVAHNRDEFLKLFVARKDDNFCKVAILGLHDSKENFEMAEHLINHIKKADISTGIILLAPPDRIDDVKKTVRMNIDSYIPMNANTILRVHNTIKKLISEHSLLIFRKKRNISFYILMIFIALSIVFAVVAWFRLPMYF
jgi:DNA-binding NarL/FixJ family response regulator